MLKHISALVTGGASGLGKATVERLAKQGASVVIYDLPSSDGEKVASELGNNVVFAPGDVTNEDDVVKALDICSREFRGLNTLVNCAGIGLAQRTLDLRNNEPHSLEDFRRVLTVNTLGTLNVTRLASVLFVANEPDSDQGRGVVINTSSIAAFEGQVGQVAYAASKGAISSMTIPLTRDFSAIGVRVVTIAPGLFETPLLTLLPEKTTAMLTKCASHPKRLGKPDEFASLVQHIIENQMLNGCVIRLDAGMRMT